MVHVLTFTSAQNADTVAGACGLDVVRPIAEIATNASRSRIMTGLTMGTFFLSQVHKSMAKTWERSSERNKPARPKTKGKRETERQGAVSSPSG